MLQDIIIVDNVFSDPDAVVEFANKQTFIPKDNYPSLGKIYWNGSRTKNLIENNNHQIIDIVNEIISSSIRKNGFDIFNFNWKWTGDFFFHRVDDSAIYSKSWTHIDPGAIYAGVVYLNKNPSHNSGTIIYKNGEPLIIDNVYNRLVLYNGSLPHSTHGGFGQGENSRLTFTLFIHNISMSVTNIQG